MRVLKHHIWAFSTLFCILIISGHNLIAQEKTYMATELQKVLADRCDISHWETDKGLSDIIKLPTGAGNAAVHYAKLADLYKKEDKQGAFLLKGGQLGIKEIVAASKIRDCDLVPDVYKPMTEYSPEGPSVFVFRIYLEALLKQAKAYEAENKYREAEELFRAGIIMGWHFTEDRPNLLSYFVGLTIQETAVKEYAKYLGRMAMGAESKRANDYAKELLKITRRVRVKSRTILNSWTSFAALEACRKSALKDAEKVWRQEAIINLGVMQNGYPGPHGVFFKGPTAQNIARNTLKDLANNDQDKSIKELASWCLENMTEEKFRQNKDNPENM